MCQISLNIKNDLFLCYFVVLVVIFGTQLIILHIAKGLPAYKQNTVVIILNFENIKIPKASRRVNNV